MPFEPRWGVSCQNESAKMYNDVVPLTMYLLINSILIKKDWCIEYYNTRVHGSLLASADACRGMTQVSLMGLTSRMFCGYYLFFYDKGM